jgi:Icc-related predicted phosphoesterase
MEPRLKTVFHDLGEDTEEVFIVPLSDLHIGAAFDQKKFEGYREWILDRDNAYCVINGDVVDNAITESIGDTYGTMRPDEQKELAEDLIRPLAEAGKILAWVDGNHEIRTARQTDEYIGKTLCKILGLHTREHSIYSPDGVFLFLNVGYDKKKGKRNRITYTGFMLHGFSGGKRMGGKVNAAEDMARSVVSDFYIVSHTHTKFAFPGRIIMPDTRTKTIRYRKQLFISTGSFMEWDGYAIRKGFRPANLGSPKIRLSGNSKDLHCSI